MKKMWLSVLALVVVGALTACGGSASEGMSGTGGAGTETSPPAATGNAVDVNISATNYQFDQKEYRVKSGDTVNLTFASEEGMHGMQIKGLDVDLKDGETASFTAEAGEYDIVCSIMCGTGHGDMVAKLIVE